MTPSDPTERIPGMGGDPDATDVIPTVGQSSQPAGRDSTAQLDPVGASHPRAVPDSTVVVGRDPTPYEDGEVAQGDDELDAADARSRFAAARSRVLRWDAGYCAVAGGVLVALWADGRAIEGLPDWFALGGGLALVAWAGVLWGVSLGRVAKATTLLVGMLNMAAGGAAFAWGWLDAGVSQVVLVVAAQVAVLGLWQLLTSVRR